MAQRPVNDNIYLDHGATTPVRSEVIDAMIPYWTTSYGNPSSVHRFGQRASDGLLGARETIASLLNSKPGEIIFTGCGSESDNLAIRGVMWEARRSGRGNHLITTSIEHKAVLETAIQLRDSASFDLTILPVDNFGQINVGELEAAIRPDTVLASIMTANNEIGTLQPILEIGTLLRENGVLFHTDAIQAAALTNWDMQRMPVDLMSLAPHKFYGPKGIGILYARSDLELIPSLTGGSQENGRRAGTENVAFAVGAAEALRLTMAERDELTNHYQKLTSLIIQGILDSFSGDCILTGHPIERLANNASFAFRNISGNDLLLHLDIEGISVSSGSACLSGDPEPSSVLEAIGLAGDWTQGGLRITVGKQNNEKDVHDLLEILPIIVRRLRQLSVRFS
jgi:cysteine desulfurase